MIATTRTESSHWYLPDGAPYYEVPNASKPGEMRPVTLRDARKVGAVPSVTTVLKMLSKPGLDRWKIEQAIIAALTLPRLPDEPDQAYASRVAEDAEETSRKAADFGTRLHGAIEFVVANGITGADHEFDADLWPFISSFATWWDAHCDELRGCIVDWKTSSSMKPYPEWCWQMAGYRAEASGWDDDQIIVERSFGNLTHGYGGKVDFVWPSPIGPLDCANVIISSVEPGKIEVKRWSEDELACGWEIFRAALQLWKLVNGYDPTKGGK